MDNACVIIGETNRAGAIKKLLSTSDVPTAAIAHNTGHEAIVNACAKLRSLKLVVVLCRDFPQDVGLGLLAELRQGLEEGVGLHAFVDDVEAYKSTQEDFEELDVKVMCHFPLEPILIASTIKQRWFPKGGREDGETSPGNHGRNGSSISTAGNGGRREAGVSVPGARLIARQDKTHAPESPPPVRQSESQGASRAPRAQATGIRVAPPRSLVEKPSAPVLGDDMQGVLTELFESFRRNDPLSPKPTAASVVGKHGTIVKLDPRRIKPLPDQPRQESNPGFTKESLKGLGEQIKLAGQMEEILVCPLVGVPDYDAQLIDGERRLRSCKLVGIYIYATVREDITPAEAKKTYLMSVMRNSEKELFTTYDNIKIVHRLRKEFGMSFKEIADACCKTTPWVSQHLMLEKLHEDVQDMLDGGSNPRKITSQIAVLLVDIGSENQRSAAETILEKRMNYNQARRYVLNLRRGLKLAPTAAGRTRPSRQFDALRTLIKRNLDAVGIYLDMPTAEILLMLSHQTGGEKNGVSQDLRTLAKNLYDLAIRIEKV
jgi:ParB family transcriptional regulator, chromosome partitioning protein